MHYTFKSTATADLLMTNAAGNAMLRAIGREPAARGIVAVADLAQALRSLEAAVQRERVSRTAGDETPIDAEAPEADVGREPFDGHGEITFGQRAWPFIRMLERAKAAGVSVTWGTGTD